MKIGCCCPIDQAEIAHAAGFDYIEATVVSLKGEADDAAFAPILQTYQASPIAIGAFNVFLPGDLKVVGPGIDRPRVQAYVSTSLARVKQIGAGVVVFGSGRSRMVPDGFAREEAMDQLVTFLRDVAPVADEHGITIAIEPLRKAESNIINTVADGVELAQRVDRPSIRVLADFYHMDEEAEPLDHLIEYKDWLAHVHVADTGRGAPGTGQYPYDVFVPNLRAAGYDGMISIECRWEDFATEVGPSAIFMRQTFA